jgi:hypothetical protein
MDWSAGMLHWSSRFYRTICDWKMEAVDRLIKKEKKMEAVDRVFMLLMLFFFFFFYIYIRATHHMMSNPDAFVSSSPYQGKVSSFVSLVLETI